MKQQDDGDYNFIDKIYFNVEYPYEAKYQYLIKKHEKRVLKIGKFQRILLNIQTICMMSIKILLRVQPKQKM